jgi:glyoxylase-like metal-dependent hydrolase (beta-lactamase superfamily II)
VLQWTVGQATITSIPESETPTSPRFLYDGLDKAGVLRRAEAAPWLRPHFVSDQGYLLQKIHCLVIEVGEHRIAVDTCIGNDKDRHNEGWHRLQGPFLDDLAAAGYPPERITEVVCTHLHVDHVGWNTRLVAGQWVPTFPGARYLLVRPEVEHWRHERGLFEGEDVFGDSVAPVLDAGLADLVAPDHVITDEVRLRPTPGHTPGHVSVEVASGGQRAIITGDMVHNPLQIADPELSSAFDTDPDAARRTRRAVFPDWADGRTLVIGTHFGTPTAATMTPDGDGYRLEV